MVADQIKAEAAAIRHYSAMAKMTFGKDPVTYHLATELLADEVGHEEFLENLLGPKGAKTGSSRHGRSAGRARSSRRRSRG